MNSAKRRSNRSNEAGGWVIRAIASNDEPLIIQQREHSPGCRGKVDYGLRLVAHFLQGFYSDLGALHVDNMDAACPLKHAADNATSPCVRAVPRVKLE